MKKRLLVLGCIAMVILTGCGSSKETIKFGTAGIGGTYRMFGDTFTEMLTDKNENYDVEVKSTAGSAANVRLLSKGYIQLAIAQTDIVNDAYHGTGIFEDSQKYQGYSAIGTLYSEACQIVVRADSDIESVDDLQGKKVSIGEEESGSEQSAEQILAAYGLSDKLVDEVNLDYTDAAKELQNKKIDAFFCTAGTQTTVINELSKQCDIKLLSIDKNASGKLKSAYKFYTDYTIPAGTYTGQTEPVDTLAVKAVLLASDKVSSDTVKDITKILFQNKKDLQLALPADVILDEKTATEGVKIPFHKGAAKYYKAHGIHVTTEKESKGK